MGGGGREIICSYLHHHQSFFSQWVFHHLASVKYTFAIFLLCAFLSSIIFLPFYLFSQLVNVSNPLTVEEKFLEEHLGTKYFSPTNSPTD